MAGDLKQITLGVLARKFQTDSFEISPLGEAETAVRLGIKFCWGLAKVTPFGGLLFFLNTFNQQSSATSFFS